MTLRRRRTIEVPYSVGKYLLDNAELHSMKVYPQEHTASFLVELSADKARKGRKMERNWEDLFSPQGVAEGDKAQLETVRTAFKTLASVLQQELPQGRYKSLVLTKLEEAAMFSTKACSHR